MVRLSVVVITLNEERNIGRCLASVSWADEVVVVDSGSTDATAGIARAAGAKVLEHPFDGDLPQRARGFAASTGEWILVLDADEAVSEGLAGEIRAAVADPAGPAGEAASNGPDGYEVPILMSFRGRWIRNGGWYPGYTLRLFRRAAVKTEEAAVHGGYAVPGTPGRFVHPVHHWSYDSIAHYLGKMNDYTSLQVTNLLRSRPGYRPGPAKLILSPLSHFVRNYFTRRGYRDGAEGFLLAVLDSLYALALYSKLWEAKLWERGRFAGALEAPPVDTASILAMKRRYQA